MAEHAGFCFGVRRAFNLVENNYPELKKPIQMYGSLVHNEEVINELNKKGVEVVHSLNQVKQGTLIITAHGISPVQRKKLESFSQLDILDTTCPRVTHIHEVVQQFHVEGRKVLIFGDRKHQEVKGIKGVNKDATHVFSGLEGFRKLNIDDEEKVGLVAQTTQNKEKFRKITQEARNRFQDIVIMDTICNTTSWRQQEAKRMASSHDVMIVVGSSTSANTNRLYQVSKKINPDSFFVGTAKDIRKSWFQNKKKVGITAGASTPEWVIQEVVNTLKNMGK